MSGAAGGHEGFSRLDRAHDVQRTARRQQKMGPITAKLGRLDFVEAIQPCIGRLRPEAGSTSSPGPD